MSYLLETIFDLYSSYELEIVILILIGIILILSIIILTIVKKRKE